MSKASSTCSCVIDCNGLHTVANLSDNLRAVVLAKLAAGDIAVPSAVWNEFKELYEDEALVLEEHIKSKITLGKKYLVGAASIADKLNSGFSRGAYDTNTDLYTASIASIEGYQVLTSHSQMPAYKAMKCTAVDVGVWATSEDDS